MVNWTIRGSDDVPKDTRVITITHRDKSKPLISMPVDEELARALKEAPTRAADGKVGADWLIPSAADLKALFNLGAAEKTALLDPAKENIDTETLKVRLRTGADVNARDDNKASTQSGPKI